MKIRSLILSTTLSSLVLLLQIQSAHAVNIAIFDTGINKSILGGVIDPTAEGDFVNNDGDASDDAPNSHGTSAGHVAISSGTGITLTSIKVFGPNFETSPAILAAAFNHIAAFDHVKVLTLTGASIANTPIEALMAVDNAGKITVFAAGNFAGANPAGDAQKAALLNLGMIAGGVTPDGSQLQSFSNRAGEFQDYFITTQTFSTLNSLDGTSMAAPRVAAAAATVMDQFGFLAPDQVRQLLFDTANDIGEPGVDGIYGHGVLNLAAALATAGAGNIPTSSGGGGSSGGGVGLAALAVGGALAYTLLNKNDEQLQRTVLVDAYGRAFTFGFDDRIVVRDKKPSIFSLLGNQQAEFELVGLSQTENSYTQALITDQTFDPFRFTSGDEQIDKHVGFLHRTANPDNYYALGLNTDLSSDFGALSFQAKENQQSQAKFAFNELFTTPILGYSSQGSSFMYGWDNQDIEHKFGLAVVDDQEENGQVSNSILYESSVNKDHFRIGFQLGALIENGSLLGGSSDSALGVDQTTTYYLGVNGSYNLTKNISLLGGYFQGTSSIEESKISLLGNFSSIRTQGYAVGMLVDNLFSNNGRFGFSYSSPLQSIGGSATLTLPVSQDRNTGEIGFSSSNISFSDADKEKIIEAYYSYQLSPKSSLFTHFSYTQNPVSNLDISRDRTIYLGWKHLF